LYDRFLNQGAVMGDSFGLENVLWFANNKEDAYEEPTIKRSRSHNYVSKEVINVRENVGLIEVANFAKHEFKGPEARKFLDHILAGKLPKPGRISLSPMLTYRGKLYGDLTVACLEENEFIVFGSGAAQEMHRRWFENHLGKFKVQYKNRSDEFHGISIAGPNSRKVLEKIVRENVSNEKFKFRDSRRMFVGGVPAIINRISFTGELGYEIYVAPHYQLKLFEEIMEAGKEFDINPFGGRALMSMRLEKNWGAWTLDYRPDFTAKETGLDTFINWDKEFIGKENAQKDYSLHKITPLIVETNDIDVTNNEAVMTGKDSIGYVTSGGFAHFVNKSVAFTYLNKDKINKENKIQIEINGDLFNCSLINEPLYDPSGQKMRS
jgi:dimethylglycine dehydrogenase